MTLLFFLAGIAIAQPDQSTIDKRIKRNGQTLDNDTTMLYTMYSSKAKGFTDPGGILGWDKSENTDSVNNKVNKALQISRNNFLKAHDNFSCDHFSLNVFFVRTSLKISLDKTDFFIRKDSDPDNVLKGEDINIALGTDQYYLYVCTDCTVDSTTVISKQYSSILNQRCKIK